MVLVPYTVILFQQEFNNGGTSTDDMFPFEKHNNNCWNSNTKQAIHNVGVFSDFPDTTERLVLLHYVDGSGLIAVNYGN